MICASKPLKEVSELVVWHAFVVPETRVTNAFAEQVFPRQGIEGRVW